MKVAIAGSTGLVGQALIPFLKTQGHFITPIVKTGEGILWDPEKGDMDPLKLEGIDVIINLCGESISKGRWTEAKKERILASRMQTTLTLANAIASLEKKPSLFLNASAIGFYGNQGDKTLDETSANGIGFLAHVCEEWEKALEPALKEGVRCVSTRFGVILSGKGGALKAMKTPFLFGLGGVIGNGKQYVSWVSIDDVLGAIAHIIATPQIEGPVNIVSPYPVTNKEFTQTLGSVLRRPTVFPLPAPLARLVMGEMADELMLSSQNVKPATLEKSGYKFLYPNLKPALQHLLD